ncbi:MAG: radical SAM protein, partial [Bacillota bacterium]|nr:radical SAM protein [Bacillota bacterium]
NRRITTLEYKSVLDRAAELGLHGYMQDRSSADTGFTPQFDLEGV